MAEGQEDTERSEDPTQKRLDEALERGDVARSQEVNTWFVDRGRRAAPDGVFGPDGNNLATTLRGLVAHSGSIRVDGRGFTSIVEKLSLEVVAAVAIPLLLLALAAVGGNMIQHRLVWSAEALKPKMSKISPMAGFGRLFSKQALANFVKGLIKLAVIGTIMTALIYPERFRLDALVHIDPAAMLSITQSLSLQMMGAVVAVLALIAAADYLFQYRQWFERQKMSVRELKDEFKQTNGNPEVKAKIQIRQTLAQTHDGGRRMPPWSSQPDPLRGRVKYSAHERPDLCCQGRRSQSRKIREVATDHNIPIVENSRSPARSMQPWRLIRRRAEHHQAVAEAIDT
jgi:flagellar biosynthetic protein FlhB